jgi:hypothetical protein
MRPLGIRVLFGVVRAVARRRKKNPLHQGNSATSRSAVIERSTTCSRDSRVCSSIIDAIFTARPSTVESNWKSRPHHLRCIRVDRWWAEPIGRHDAFEQIRRDPTIGLLRKLA